MAEFFNLGLAPKVRLPSDSENDRQSLDTMHHTRKMMGYIVITLVIILCWAVSMPTWSSMFTTFLNVSQPERHVELAMILFPFYVTFMFGNLCNYIINTFLLSNENS